MGPCITCGRPGPYGTAHPRKRVTVWACADHRAALPKQEDKDFTATEAEDREAAMRQMAAQLCREGFKEDLTKMGFEVFHEAFTQGLEAYFACRAARLRP